MSSATEHLIRLGILKERAFLVDGFTSTYTGLVCNANLIVTVGGGVAALLREAIGRGTVKGYLIDPMTHILSVSREAISNREGNIRSGVLRLLEEYDLPQSIVEAIPIDPSLIRDGAARSLAESVVRFQREAILATASRDKEYIDYAEEGNVPLSAFKPERLIAPYLFIAQNQYFEEALRANAELFKHTASIANETPIAYVMVQKQLLQNQEHTDTIVEYYRATGAKTVFVWITRLDEHSARLDELNACYSFIRKLVDSGMEVVRVYSSCLPFSIKDERLTGVCHGPGYGESREETPVGGGLPTPKFYMPMLHKRIQFEQAQIYVQRVIGNSVQSYFDRICNCPACQRVMENNLANFARFGEVDLSTQERYNRKTKQVEEIERPYATSASVRLSAEHYMYSKFQELSAFRARSRDEIRHDFQVTHREFTALNMGAESRHLESWASITW